MSNYYGANRRSSGPKLGVFGELHVQFVKQGPGAWNRKRAAVDGEGMAIGGAITIIAADFPGIFPAVRILSGGGPSREPSQGLNRRCSPGRQVDFVGLNHGVRLGLNQGTAPQIAQLGQD